MCSVLVAATSAQYLGYPYAVGSPYALGAPLTYTYTPHVVKPVVKEVEVEVPHITYAVKETGCVNSFGLAVPCLQEGEARRKRAADEEAAPGEIILLLCNINTKLCEPRIIFRHQPRLQMQGKLCKLC